MGHRDKSCAQLVSTIADFVGNLGASPPAPPFASGFGVRGSAPPCVGVVESPTQTTSPNRPPMFGTPCQKNGSLSAPKSNSGKAMTAHHRCFGTAVPALVTRPGIVQGTGAVAPSDEGLRGPHTPASLATRFVRALFRVQVWRKKYLLTCAYPYSFRLPRSIGGQALGTMCRYFHRTSPEIRKTPSGGAED